MFVGGLEESAFLQASAMPEICEARGLGPEP